MRLKTFYKHDLKKVYMILEGKEDKEDYQVIMLKENEIPGVLNMDVRYLDNQSQYYYDISSKTSFQILHEKIHLTCQDMKTLINDLLQTIQNLQQYMLDGRCILLEPEYIFCESEQYYFCYYPSCEQDIKQEFHKLTEFFVREVDYKDEEGVHLAYTLHKATMEENYSLEEIMNRLMSEAENEAEVEQVPIVDYTERLEQSMLEESMIEERDTMWDSVKKFLERSKRRKYGYSAEDL